MSDELAGSKKKEKVKDLLNEHYNQRVVARMNERLDQIEKDCQTRLTEINDSLNAQLKKIDDRSRAIQGFLVQEVMSEFKNKVNNAQVTMDAFIAVVAEHGVKIDDLNAKIDAKKVELNQVRQVEAEKRFADSMNKEQAEKDAQQAASAPSAQPAAQEQPVA